MNKLINEHQYTKLSDIVMEISDRLKVPEEVLQRLGENNQIWDGRTLSHGYPGICMLMGELAQHFPDSDWDKHGHAQMKIINQVIDTDLKDNMALFSGLAGIGMAAYTLSDNGNRYQNFIAELNSLLMNTIDTKLNHFFENGNYDLKITDIDVISGFSGVCGYLLFCKNNSETLLRIKKILKYFICITEDIEIDGMIVPGWHISSQNQFLETERESYPKGNFNTGLSHGISGPLALLSISLLNDIEIDGQRQAIQKIADWLIQWSCEDEYGIYMTGHIDILELTGEKERKKEYTNREAWCYGNPGVARSIWLAGKSLNSNKYKAFAIDTFKSTFKRPVNDWGIFSPIFCHGIAGNIQIFKLMYEDSQNEIFRAAISDMIPCLIKYYDKNNTFGFCDFNYTTGPVHSPGLLDGSTGIVLSILSLLKPVKTNWNSVFLLT